MSLSPEIKAMLNAAKTKYGVPDEPHDHCRDSYEQLFEEFDEQDSAWSARDSLVQLGLRKATKRELRSILEMMIAVDA